MAEQTSPSQNPKTVATGLDTCFGIRDPKWDRTLEKHKEILAPISQERASGRIASYGTEQARFDPPYIARDKAISDFVKELLESGKKYVVITSPKARAQMEAFNFPCGHELLSRAIDVEGVHFGHLDGRYGEGLFEKIHAVEAQPDIIIGIGLGSVTDWAKLAAHKFSTELVIVPGALSTNAAFTGNVIIRDDLHSAADEQGKYEQYSFTAHAAHRVIVDLDFIALNPRGNAAGIGDLLSSFVALRDWDLAIEKNGERRDDAVYNETEHLLAELIGASREVSAFSKCGLKTLAAHNSSCSKLMTRFRSGRPKAGSEHILAEGLERITRGRKILHGEMIGATTLIMTELFNRNAGRWISADFMKILSRNFGVCLELDVIGLKKEELVKALTDQRPKPQRFSFFDVFQVSEAEAWDVVKKTFG